MKLEKGTRHTDPISAYLFIVVLETGFQIIKEHQILKTLTFIWRKLLTLLAWMIPHFFLEYTESAINILETFINFLYFFGLGLKSNNSKNDIVSICVLQGVKIKLSSIRCLKLDEDPMKIIIIINNIINNLIMTRISKSTLQTLTMC